MQFLEEEFAADIVYGRALAQAAHLFPREALMSETEQVRLETASESPVSETQYVCTLRALLQAAVYDGHELDDLLGKAIEDQRSGRNAGVWGAQMREDDVISEVRFVLPEFAEQATQVADPSCASSGKDNS